MATSSDNGVPVAVGDVVFRRIYEKSGLGYGLVGSDLRFLDVNPVRSQVVIATRDRVLVMVIASRGFVEGVR